MASYAEYLAYGVPIKPAVLLSSAANAHPRVWNFDGGLTVSADFECANLQAISVVPEETKVRRRCVFGDTFANMYVGNSWWVNPAALRPPRLVYTSQSNVRHLRMSARPDLGHNGLSECSLVRTRLSRFNSDITYLEHAIKHANCVVIRD